MPLKVSPEGNLKLSRWRKKEIRGEEWFNSCTDEFQSPFPMIHIFIFCCTFYRNILLILHSVQGTLSTVLVIQMNVRVYHNFRQGSTIKHSHHKTFFFLSPEYFTIKSDTAPQSGLPSGLLYNWSAVLHDRVKITSSNSVLTFASPEMSVRDLLNRTLSAYLHIICS